MLANLQKLCFTPSSFCFAPLFQTAGFGVFAGRAFKKDETVLRSWTTLFLPNNFPRQQTARCYVFNHNKTHMALDLDYGSIINHHESANARAIGRYKDMHYRVCLFSICGSQCQKLCSMRTCTHEYIYMHARHIHNTHTCTHKHLQGRKRHRGRTGNFYSVWQRAVV